MIQHVTLILTAAQIIMSVVFLIGTIYSRLAWFIKSFLIVVGLVTSMSSYWIFKSSLGWPVADMPKEEMQIVASIVEEPTPTSKGAIYVWYKPTNSPIPRSIVIPYNKNSHEKLQQAQEKAKKGQRSYMKTVSPPRAGNTDGRIDSSQNKPEDELDFVPPPSFRFEK